VATIAQPGAKIEIAGILNQGEPAVDYIEFVPASVAPPPNNQMLIQLKLS